MADFITETEKLLKLLNGDYLCMFEKVSEENIDGLECLSNLSNLKINLNKFYEKQIEKQIDKYVDMLNDPNYVKKTNIIDNLYIFLSNNLVSDNIKNKIKSELKKDRNNLLTIIEKRTTSDNIEQTSINKFINQKVSYLDNTLEILDTMNLDKNKNTFDEFEKYLESENFKKNEFVDNFLYSEYSQKRYLSKFKHVPKKDNSFKINVLNKFNILDKIDLSNKIIQEFKFLEQLYSGTNYGNKIMNYIITYGEVLECVNKCIENDICKCIEKLNSICKLSERENIRHKLYKYLSISSINIEYKYKIIKCLSEIHKKYELYLTNEIPYIGEYYMLKNGIHSEQYLNYVYNFNKFERLILDNRIYDIGSKKPSEIERQRDFAKLINNSELEVLYTISHFYYRHISDHTVHLDFKNINTGKLYTSICIRLQDAKSCVFCDNPYTIFLTENVFNCFASGIRKIGCLNIKRKPIS